VDVALVMLCAALAAAVQSTVAFGFSLVFVPLATLLIGPRDAVVVSITLSTVIATIIYLEHLPRARLRSVAPLAAAGIAATPLGIVLLAVADEQLLRLIVAAGVLAGVPTTLASEHRHEASREPLPALIAAGLASGVLRGATSFAGPPIVLYQHWVGGAPAELRARLILYMVLIAVPGFGMAAGAGLVTQRVITLAGASLPIAVVGVLVGRVARTRFSAEWFRRASMAVLTASALAAVAAALPAVLGRAGGG